LSLLQLLLQLLLPLLKHALLIRQQRILRPQM
jgi:hypothetical protein